MMTLYRHADGREIWYNAPAHHGFLNAKKRTNVAGQVAGLNMGQKLRGLGIRRRAKGHLLAFVIFAVVECRLLNDIRAALVGRSVCNLMLTFVHFSFNKISHY